MLGNQAQRLKPLSQSHTARKTGLQPEGLGTSHTPPRSPTDPTSVLQEPLTWPWAPGEPGGRAGEGSPVLFKFCGRE